METTMWKIESKRGNENGITFGEYLYEALKVVRASGHTITNLFKIVNGVEIKVREEMYMK